MQPYTFDRKRQKKVRQRTIRKPTRWISVAYMSVMDARDKGQTVGSRICRSVKSVVESVVESVESMGGRVGRSVYSMVQSVVDRVVVTVEGRGPNRWNGEVSRAESFERWRVEGRIKSVGRSVGRSSPYLVDVSESSSLAVTIV